MTLSLSQRLNARALLRVEKTLEAIASGDKIEPSDYRSAARIFPGLLQFNGAAMAVPMLIGKSSLDARFLYLDDLANLIEVQGVFVVEGYKDLSERLRDSQGDDYLLWYHQMALAASWLKHAADLLCGSEGDEDATTDEENDDSPVPQ